ncbi:membrane-bound lytic murein transglycosylase MltF [Bdellovibrio sp. HCB290]|uniref:membrane-bound lytic murein transglycosylase MltF n=1 Tax=Bdellovibrio sp. HCB290 TaxID=3394356 RepID=UPI0039B5C97B
MLAQALRHRVLSPNTMGKNLRFRQKLNQFFVASGLAAMTFFMNGCDAIYWNEQDSLANVQGRGEITVLTTKNPLIYSKNNRGEISGIDYDLIQNFAKHYGLKVKYKVLKDESAVLEALAQGQGDVAAARIRTPENRSAFLTGPAYEDTALSLYCQRKSQIQNIQDLAGKSVGILHKDNYAGFSQRLTQLSPTTQIQLITARTQDLLEQLNNKKMDCVITENVSGDFYVRFHKNIEKITTITDAYALSWLLTPDSQDLARLMQAWYQSASRSDSIMRIMDRYKTTLNQLDKADISRFFQNIEEILPTYRQAFKDAGVEHGLPWQLIASVAYQESHWNPDARSFTGVRGLMQLTTDTALHVGIDDRTDPLQSIWGGSKYLRYLLDKMPRSMNKKDRLAMALAAYNVGYAHLRDAQKLAESMGRDPYSWRHMKEVLPLLADPDYTEKLEYGYARGYETVEFVERVKSFYSLMSAG